MNITAAMVKELRERTGSGMMECKKALVEMNGDLDAAIEHMRKTGLAKADKKAGRTAAEGRVGVSVSSDGKQAAMVEINCETDFVSKGDEFAKYVNDVVASIVQNQAATIEDVMSLKLASENKSIDEVRRTLVAKLGENINVRRFERFSSNEGFVSSYSHGSKIGVIVELSGADQALGKDIAMHVAASKPICVSENEIAPEIIAKEKEIFIAQAAQSGKPAEIIEKMVVGRVKKFLGEVTLIGQPFVKNPDISIAQLVSEKNNQVQRFTRYEVGEGIEKKQENFAEEVMAQVRGN